MSFELETLIGPADAVAVSASRTAPEKVENLFVKAPVLDFDSPWAGPGQSESGPGRAQGREDAGRTGPAI